MTGHTLLDTPDLSFTQGDEKWHKLRKRALNDLYFMSTFVLGYGDLFPLEQETHLLPLRFIERRTGIPDIDDAPKQLIMWPRKTGKSSTGTIASAIQEACRDPNTAILIANEKQETAQDFIGTIKYNFETNDLLRSLFPEVIPADFNKVIWSATRACVKRDTGRPEPTFDCIGVGGTVTGKHYDRIICDDLISREAMENARSGNWTIMNKVNRWVNQLEPLLSQQMQPFPWIRFIGTRWFNGDTYEYIEDTFTRKEAHRCYRIKAKLSNGLEVSREVYRAGNLAVMKIAGIEDGKLVFPKIWSREALEEMRENDPEFWSCNIQNDPSDASVRTFQDSWLQYWVTPDDRIAVFDKDDGTRRFVDFTDMPKIISVDPAFSANSEGARSAIVVLATDMETGKHLILEAIAQQAEPKDTVTDVINTAMKWGASRVYVELAGQQLAFLQYMEAEIRRRQAAIVVEPLKPGGRNKDVRIGTLAPYFKNSQILVNRSQIELLEEYRRYRPGARFKDLLDALAYAIEKAPVVARGGGGAFGGDARKRSDLQLSTYRARRGLQFKQ